MTRLALAVLAGFALWPTAGARAGHLAAAVSVANGGAALHLFDVQGGRVHHGVEGVPNSRRRVASDNEPMGVTAIAAIGEGSIVHLVVIDGGGRAWHITWRDGGWTDRGWQPIPSPFRLDDVSLADRPGVGVELFGGNRAAGRTVRRTLQPDGTWVGP